MTNELIDLNILPIETLAEMANEKAELVEKNARKTVSDAIDCGRYLTAIKDQIEHGKWAAWLGANWNYSQSLANKYMTISNSERVTNLKDATTIREALRMIGDDREEKAIPARADRIPDRVEVVESTSEPGQPVVQPDPDPTPDPPTIRKTAKGSEKVSEDKKPRTQPILPEIVEDDPQQSSFEEKTLSDWCEHEILEYLVATADDAKRRARALRKAADKLDPPTKFTKPDLEEVSAYFRELKAAGPESFFDFYESKGWLVGKVSMKDWRASARKWVRENQANPFGGNGNGHTESLADRVATKAARLKDIFG